MKIIGVTGGVGSGKSEILNYLSKLNEKGKYAICVLKADEAAHEVEEPGQECYNALAALMGDEILTGKGLSIDKKKMAARMFADPQLTQQVNAIVHPAVKVYILQRIKEEQERGTEFFFLEAALLIETGYKEVVDEMWYIYTDAMVRKERLRASRGYSDEKIRAIMDSQLDEKAYRAGSDFVIDNSGALEDSLLKVDERLSFLSEPQRDVSESGSDESTAALIIAAAADQIMETAEDCMHEI